MKKIYNIFYIINIICGLLIFINYFYIFNYNDLSILLTIALSAFYIFSTISFFKSKNEIDKIDVISAIIYIIFLTFILIFSVIYQINNPETFNLMYYSKYLIIPHLLIIINSNIKTHQKR